MRHFLKVAVPVLALSASVALAFPTVHEIRLQGQYDDTVESIQATKDRDLTHYYPAVALGVQQDALKAYPWASANCTCLVVDQLIGPAGFKASFKSATITWQAGQPVVALKVNIAAPASTGRSDLTLRLRNTMTGQVFDLAMPVLVASAPAVVAAPPR